MIAREKQKKEEQEKEDAIQAQLLEEKRRRNKEDLEKLYISQRWGMIEKKKVSPWQDLLVFSKYTKDGELLLPYQRAELTKAIDRALALFHEESGEGPAATPSKFSLLGSLGLQTPKVTPVKPKKEKKHQDREKASLQTSPIRVRQNGEDTTPPASTRKDSKQLGDLTIPMSPIRVRGDDSQAVSLTPPPSTRRGSKQPDEHSSFSVQGSPVPTTVGSTPSLTATPLVSAKDKPEVVTSILKWEDMKARIGGDEKIEKLSEDWMNFADKVRKDTSKQKHGIDLSLDLYDCCERCQVAKVNALLATKKCSPDIIVNEEPLLIVIFMKALHMDQLYGWMQPDVEELGDRKKTTQILDALVFFGADINVSCLFSGFEK